MAILPSSGGSLAEVVLPTWLLSFQLAFATWKWEGELRESCRHEDLTDEICEICEIFLENMKGK